MVMLLNGDNGTEFELALIRDAFPELQDGAADSAWLTLSFRVGTQRESWEETAPCLNIFEVQTLQEWLEAVGQDGQGDVAEVELLEPALRFSVTKQRTETVTIRIDFDLEDRPEQLAMDPDTDEADSISVVLSKEQVRAAAAELQRDLEAVMSERKFEQIEGESLGVIGVPDEELGLRPDESVSEIEEGEESDERPRGA